VKESARAVLSASEKESAAGRVVMRILLTRSGIGGNVCENADMTMRYAGTVVDVKRL
jgi:hypothetical protein